ncbi:Endonuclease/exonuclease/phosphatase [Lentinula detonsa]|uniref:Endonuclease/exonuclease/phosphatase n=1 Tax=Lentinula detonsa TaxID=2804962 RepID=A0AA38PQR9_9AGAR|nr:Endonuclease/exonuclease/phosphatase [Lentinula detonsa]
MGGRYGNKGGILSRFLIDDSSLCFVNCHLAAGQHAVRARNVDAAGMLEQQYLFPAAGEHLAFVGGGDGSMVLDHEIVFINGDMNYRIDQRRDAITAAVRANEHESLFAHDQLMKEIKYNRGCRFRFFTEGPIAFAPTYKYDRRSDVYDTSEKRRAPAWCDRVLWRSRVPSRVKQLHYQRYEVNVSDHRPISAAFNITVKRTRHEIREKKKAEVQMQWTVLQEKLLMEAREFYINSCRI